MRAGIDIGVWFAEITGQSKEQDARLFLWLHMLEETLFLLPIEHAHWNFCWSETGCCCSDWIDVAAGFCPIRVEYFPHSPDQTCKPCGAVWETRVGNYSKQWEDTGLIWIRVKSHFHPLSLWKLIKISLTSYTCVRWRSEWVKGAGMLSRCLLYLYSFPPTPSSRLSSVLLSSFWGRMWAESWPFNAHPSHIKTLSHSCTEWESAA